jgi:HEAT repeat protein
LRLACLLSAAGLTLPAAPASPRPLQDPPEAQAGKDRGSGEGQESLKTKPAGLLEVARIESLREKQIRDGKIKESILQLGIYTDPQLAFVRRKREEILAFGKHAVPHLVKAMETASGERTRINAGRIAAVILSEIDDPDIEPELLRLMASENENARANAIRCIGYMGLKAHTDLVRSNLQTENKELLAEALECLGRLGCGDIPEIASRYLKDKDSTVRVSAIRALDLQGRAGPEICTQVLAAFAESEDSAVQDAALDFLKKYGGAECVPVLIERYEDGGIKRRERYTILSALTAIGMRIQDDSRGRIVEFLKGLLDQADFDTVKRAAFHLNDLGDDSGVEVLTGSMDKLIERHGNAEYYFRRGEIFLQFKKYREARRDFLEGLRKDKRAGRYGIQKVYIALARCYAGEERYPDAERYLRKAEPEDPAGLPLLYEEFVKMAEDPHYARLFEAVWD